ncbi:TIGR01777 family oxidoreductase [Nocardia aurantia]|uniref:Epimerase family protein n=1 Tax=Nocardia aurantia TaxID=2585199 RepID=A0A7K0DIL4_9NOCA|nr:TIGR01777 family oxidoreductase [Nocardia aurantia]MQY25640.1 Epimerase family protein [Nocardia aurantia]
MKVVVAGSSGLIGTALVAALRRDGHRAIRLVRRRAATGDELEWDPARARVPASALRGADAVVNLCGAGIGRRRWTGAYKQELRDSRITPTDVLAGAVAAAEIPVLVNASGIHFYGDTGDRIVTETDSAGTGFLATLCRDWEAATGPAAAAGARVVLLRTAMVLTPHDGLLGRLRPLFTLGLGSRLGDGRQYFSWITLDDTVAAIRFALDDENIRGPVNLTAPVPVTNAEFTRVLAAALRRTARLRVPAAPLRLLAGELADEGILHGPRAFPAALDAAGYPFRHPALKEALAELLSGQYVSNAR